ncbi:ATP-dependent nuclease [Sorangium sp. So ce124]|uniref:ATP-dependent nuclease n=1 Tax=Sorangium sp. So ce124 TaxID=3133280 RepID=UPI003F646E8F
MKYRTTIRESLTRKLREKSETGDYQKYLMEMTLHRLRAFRDARIRFRFPVTAVIGPNGSGKSTVLGAAGLIYSDMKPGNFFAVSTADEEAMQGVRIAYKVIDRKFKKDGDIERSATRPKKKWERKTLDRKVLYFGFRRTVPATERPEFTKFRTGVKEIDGAGYASLGPDVIEHASRILSLDVAKYEKSTLKTPMIGYAGDVKYSEFHFGTGVSVIIELVWNLENLDPKEQALVLIEEIENTLHPFAVRKLVEYLVSVADRKRCQVIFTTHSEYALDPLPREAIWAAKDGILVNGKLRVADMLTFRGNTDTKLAVFCEDATAIDWLQGMLRASGMSDELGMIEFYPVGSFGSVSEMVASHNRNPSRRFNAVGFVDGDAPADFRAAPEVFRLPGTYAPEEVIIESVIDKFHANLAVLSIALQQRSEDQERVRKTITEQFRDASDMHLVFSQIGERLGYVPEQTVRLALIKAYCDGAKEQVAAISTIIHERLGAADADARSS